jgi:hypothetical protein
MKKIINPQMALLAVGVLQPTSAAEVAGFLSTVFSEAGMAPSLDEFRAFLTEQLHEQRVVQVSRDGEPYYSLSFLGNHYLPAGLRLKRDKFRAYLLRDAHFARFIESRDVEQGLAGASPASDTSSGIKGRAPNKLVRPAFGLRFALGRAYWPRIQRQFDRTGPTRLSRDAFPIFLSFTSKEGVRAATQRALVFDYVGLGVCIGISAQMIWKIAHESHRHYRVFEIPKRGGGTRLIESPRVFLKAIQWFLSDFIFHALPKHPAVHSFSFARSIATNAVSHEGRPFVGNADIENYFGSVSESLVARHLEKNGFEKFEAVVLAKLCCNRGVLPQVAPTSPIISNSILYDFDSAISKYCDAKNLKYTRYADDITISGTERKAIALGLRYVSARLRAYGLRLNADKTRIASSVGQQRVTGVVVNSSAAPSRLYRRKARAIFHQAKQSPQNNVSRISELAGIVGFLKIFPRLAQSQEVASYEAILREVKEARRGGQRGILF